MTSDPYSPGYLPDDHGTRSGLGDVGHGNQFGLDLYSLYKAGRLHFPAQAERFSGLTADAQYAGHGVTMVQSAAGNPAALTKILDLRERLHTALYKTTLTLRDLGPVLVKTADDYAATDDDARGAFKGMLGSTKERGLYTEPPTVVPDPPRPDDPWEPPQEYIPKPGGQQVPI
jgi:hypothetical protein